MDKKELEVFAKQAAKVLSQSKSVGHARYVF